MSLWLLVGVVAVVIACWAWAVRRLRRARERAALRIWEHWEPPKGEGDFPEPWSIDFVEMTLRIGDDTVEVRRRDGVWERLLETSQTWEALSEFQDSIEAQYQRFLVD